MTLHDVMKAVDELSSEDLRVLHHYIEQRQQTSATDKSTALSAVIAAMREGLSEQDLDEIEWAMNVEYIQPLDKSDL